MYIANTPMSGKIPFGTNHCLQVMVFPCSLPSQFMGWVGWRALVFQHHACITLRWGVCGLRALGVSDAWLRCAVQHLAAPAPAGRLFPGGGFCAAAWRREGFPRRQRPHSRGHATRPDATYVRMCSRAGAHGHVPVGIDVAWGAILVGDKGNRREPRGKEAETIRESEGKHTGSTRGTVRNCEAPKWVPQ